MSLLKKCKKKGLDYSEVTEGDFFEVFQVLKQMPEWSDMTEKELLLHLKKKLTQ